MTFLTVSTTLASHADAVALARELIGQRLAACVQFFPIRSVYRWKGQVESASEYLVQAKTRASLASRLMNFIREHHSYDVPEITVMPILNADARYRKWLASETEPAPKKNAKNRKR